jgi:outer membrane lipoprotein SlyB
MNRTLLALPLAAAALVSLGGCVVARPDTVPHHATQRASRIVDATVLSLRPVTVQSGYQTGAGATIGAVAGGVAGSNVGGWREGMVLGAVGMVAGALIGDAIERDAAREPGWEIVVQLRNGERRSIMQAKSVEDLREGDQVVLVMGGGRTRVQRAPAGTPPISNAPAPVYSPGGPVAAQAAPAAPAATPAAARPSTPGPTTAPRSAPPLPAAAAPAPAQGASAPVYTPNPS